MGRGPRIGDAFGALLAAALEVDGQPGRVFEVIERDDGHVRVNDAARYLLPSWGTLDDWLYEHVRGDVLDVGCGAGRCALVLQDRGARVVGLDVSPGAVEICRRRGVREVVLGGVQDLDPEGAFDTILLAGNNLGLLGSPAAAGPFLERLAQLSTGPGAQILATGIGHEPGATDGPDGGYQLDNEARGRLPWQMTMRSRFRDLATEWFDYLFLRVEELVELLDDSPWRITGHVHEGQGYAVRLELTAG